MSDQFWRNVFLISAFFNFIIGISLFFDLGPLAAARGIEMMRFDALYSPLIGWFIIVFGLSYLALSQDLANKTLALLGLTGKLGVIILVWFAWASGLAPLSMAALTFVDLVFAVLFAVFLFVPK
jgi:hypothetical protein